jgi:SAM-dependent methyltransferase
VQKDPLKGSSWSQAATVAGFVASPPNFALMRFAEQERRTGGRRVVDIGCGAGRNALPLSAGGWDVLGVDLSWAMLRAAAERSRRESPDSHLQFALAAMEHLPVRDESVDLIVAHGIWNLARSSAQFRAATREAARIARPGAALFVFTFSRTTLPPEASPVAAESFVFTQFSGDPQCFLTDAQLLAELDTVGFTVDPAVPLAEHNRPATGALRVGGPPVIYQGSFRMRA